VGTLKTYNRWRNTAIAMALIGLLLIIGAML
jgi:hypothetical protein